MEAWPQSKPISAIQILEPLLTYTIFNPYHTTSITTTNSKNFQTWHRSQQSIARTSKLVDKMQFTNPSEELKLLLEAASNNVLELWKVSAATNNVNLKLITRFSKDKFILEKIHNIKILKYYKTLKYTSISSLPHFKLGITLKY